MTDSALKTALLSLSVENDNHWTKAGLPRVETLKFLTGDSSLTQESVAAELPGFNRESATSPFNVVKIEKVKDEVLPLTLSEQLVFAQIELEKVRKVFIEAEKSLISKTDIVNILAERISIEIGVESSQEAIMNFLKGQQDALQVRAAKQKMILDSGINLKELAEGLKSPLDASLTRKR